MARLVKIEERGFGFGVLASESESSDRSNGKRSLRGKG
jgi:hypothetical protein